MITIYLVICLYFLNSDCMLSLIIDGHQKGARNICDHLTGNKICIPEIGDLELGCIQTPTIGSYSCVKHMENEKVQ